MKAIKINYELKQMLKDYSDKGITYDGSINRLIHEVSDYMPIVSKDTEAVNININEDTMAKLKAYGLTVGESYENILIRMMLISQTLNSSNE